MQTYVHFVFLVDMESVKTNNINVTVSQEDLADRLAAGKFLSNRMPSGNLPEVG